MDQGIAGVIAGIAGLVGAGIGGFATAYGARVGAQKTIEAAQAQVSHQSTAEHAHWVREQRRQAYSDAMETHGTFITSLNVAVSQLSAAPPLSSETVTELQEKLVALGLAATRIHLWGPEEAVSKANTLARAAHRRLEALKGWSAATESATAYRDTRPRRREYGEATDAETTARADFVTVARSTLAAAP
ncbi:hypothetical protein [Streptomyces antibioticus]|uniref:Uncharacterized protein n=2 Tax=Streptomyces antibioticus TaxID=1890 RepID=A0AAE7CLQ6_STRAT|nr:hypothetical protein [Streptomyces antibioticus]QIT44993.1 hypothetical protein HCX60_16740 [Streptomyces antibioticus]